LRRRKQPLEFPDTGRDHGLGQEACCVFRPLLFQTSVAFQ
jgi:hypothetical protein